jgi:hypothetical protein
VVFPFLALAIVASKKEPSDPLSSSTVEASSKLSVEFSNSAEEVAVVCACGGVSNLLIKDGES